MKKTLLLTCTTFTLATFITACGESMPYVNTDTTNACETLNKKLLKVDRFTKVVNETSAFHLEEASSAMITPGITTSNNKRKMLRDAAKRKAELQAEQQKFGCNVAKN